MSDCPECGMRDDDWFLCRRENCAVKAKEGGTATIARLHRENAELRAALDEAEQTLRLVEHPSFEDPVNGDEVRRLGDRIGFGALMSSAQAAWRRRLQEHGGPVGGEFVSGPCYSTVTNTLRKIRAALRRPE